MSKITLFGIKNCGTMKKAMTWLDQHHVDYHFHDYKKGGIDTEHLTFWLTQSPWEELINRRGMTWRKLPDDSKENIDNEKAIKLMLANTSLIKRPLLVIGDTVHLGFNPDYYTQIFGD